VTRTDGPSTQCAYFAPLRADLTGGYTDVSPLIEQHPSRAISIALSYGVHVTARHVLDGRVSVYISDTHGLVDTAAGTVESLRSKPGVISIIAHAMQTVSCSAVIKVHVDFPLGCGAGTSGAISVAVLAALLRIAGIDHMPFASLPHIAAGIELTAGNLGGLQDQFAAVVGGFNSYCFDSGSVVVESLARNTELLADAVIALPPTNEHRLGSARLVERVLTSARAGDKQTIDALAGLRKCGEDMVALMAVDSPTVAEFATYVRKVLEHQVMLHPVVRDGIVASLPWSLVTRGLVVGKPLGGAGRGAAWLLLGPQPESVQSTLIDGGWTLMPASISRSGLRLEHVE
jgi:D-glycero-alpha-D-manno-heptose-7-phosphate kinase